MLTKCIITITVIKISNNKGRWWSQNTQFMENTFVEAIL